MRTALLAPLAALIAAVVCEHTARINGWAQRPSVWLDAAALAARSAFEWLAARFVWLSAFLEHLHLDGLAESFAAIAASAVKLASTPFFFVRAYAYGALASVHPWVVWLGSALLVACLTYALWRWARAPLARASAAVRPYVPWLASGAYMLYLGYCFAWDVHPLDVATPRFYANNIRDYDDVRAITTLGLLGVGIFLFLAILYGYCETHLSNVKAQ